MNKKNIIKSFLPVLVLMLLFFGNPSSAATNVNYGTTSFFSGKEKAVPPVSQPILDSGGSSPGWKPGDSKDSDKDSDDKDSESIFEKITDKFQSLFGNADTEFFTDPNDGSLFDYQKEKNGGNISDSEWDTYIMGPRGESYENLDEEEAAKYKNRFAQNFNFGDGEGAATPKKSKLLFTNVEINVDLTTQYVILGIVFFIAVGLVVGYYFWKKEAKLENRKYNADNDLW